MIFMKLLMFLCLYEISVSADKDRDSNVELEQIYYDLNVANELFEEFVKSYNKEYRNRKEYNYRFKVFVETLKKINELNEGSNGEVYGITKFADLTLDEFVQEQTGLRTDVPFNNTSQLASKPNLTELHTNAPENLDWRSKGIVTPAKDQMRCSSCWSFSAVACVEGQYAKKHGVLLSLSKQQLLDCYKKTCQTGDYPDKALRYAAKMGGFMLEQDYPYKGVVGRCQFQPAKVKVKVRGGRVMHIKNEEHLKELVHSYGPVPIENGVKYWIIKNSSGSRWGEQGFLRMVRGSNVCNILKYVAVAEVD